MSLITPAAQRVIFQAPSRASSWTAAFLALAVLLCVPIAADWSWRFVEAERAAAPGTQEGIERATSLAPAEAPLWLYLAQSNPDISDTALPAALRRNPYYSAAAIQLALWQEIHNQSPAAEQTLLAAEQHDRTHEIAWALANFYFRQNRDAEFWKYAKKSAQFQFARPEPLLELCWTRRPDSPWLLANVLPHEAWILPFYAAFLASKDAGPDVLPVALESLQHPPVQPDLLVSLSTWLWQHNRPEEALQLWHTLEDRRLVPFPRAPEGELLTNGGFTELYGRGFDWEIAAPAGVTTSRTSRGLNLRAENLTSSTGILWQPVPLRQGQRYTLKWRWRAEPGLVEPGGLHWIIPPHTPSAGAKALESPPFKNGEDSVEQQWTFTAAGPEVGQLLRLEYRRESGMRAWEGTLYLEDVSLRAEKQ